MPKTVISLGRYPHDISAEELRRIQQLFGADVNIARTSAVTSSEHLADCERLHPSAVLLPSDEAIFTNAVNQGIPHLVYARGRRSDVGLYRIWNLNRFPFRSLIHRELQ